MTQPDLDQWTTAFGMMAFLGLFLAPLLLMQTGGRNRSILYIVTILVLFSIVLIFYVLFWSHYLQFLRFLIVPVELLFFLVGIFFYFYLKELLQQPLTSKTRRIHYLPFGLGLGFHLLVILVGNLLPSDVWESNTFSFTRYFYQWLPWMIVGHLSGYALLILRLQPLLGSLNQQARWARWFSLCYLGFVLANWGYQLLIQLPSFNRDWDYGTSVSMSGFIGLVAVLAYRHPQLFHTTPSPDLIRSSSAVGLENVGLSQSRSGFSQLLLTDKPGIRYQHSGLPTHLAQQFAQKLRELMQSEKLYQDNGLRLETLAQRLNLSRHYLSQVLNEQLGMNFFEYINSLRIEEAQTLLAHVSSTQLNINQIAYQVGFNNRVSFNRSFKQATGLTPKEFRQRMQGHTDALADEE